MSTSSAHQQSLADVGSETRPPMLIQHDPNQPERPETEDDLMGDNLKQYEADIEAMNLILIFIPNDIYNSMDSWDTFQNDPEDPLTFAIMLLARAITHRLSTPINNRLGLIWRRNKQDYGLAPRFTKKYYSQSVETAL
ncbi:hypothetical protein Tco_1021866 [Tanacetum coccineum]